jgi:hypothetical protein
MDVKIINYCQESYRPDPETIVRHILARIPEKFLTDLGEVRIFDGNQDKEKSSEILYIQETPSSDHAWIEIYMDKKGLLSGIPFFSVLMLNIFFIGAINEHIEKHLQPHSQDPEILACSVGIFRYSWAYFGIWNPILILFKMINYVIYRIPLFEKHTWNFIRKRYLKNQGNNNESSEKEMKNDHP